MPTPKGLGKRTERVTCFCFCRFCSVQKQSFTLKPSLSVDKASKHMVRDLTFAWGWGSGSATLPDALMPGWCPQGYPGNCATQIPSIQIPVVESQVGDLNQMRCSSCTDASRKSTAQHSISS